MKKSLILLLGLLPFLTSAQPATALEDTTTPTNQPSPNQQYDIQIENGGLLIAPLKKRIDVKILYEGIGEPYSVAATVENVVKYLRAANTHLTIVLSPGAANVEIGDLKFQSGNMNALMQALSIATDGAVEGRPLVQRGPFGANFGGRSSSSTENEWALVATSRKREASTLEAFNLSGYIQTLGNNPSADSIRKKIDEIQELILDALRQLHPNDLGAHDPHFRYHPGTHLLIVTGKPEAIEVSRKIVNALSGQTRTEREDLLLDMSSTTNHN